MRILTAALVLGSACGGDDGATTTSDAGINADSGGGDAAGDAGPTTTYYLVDLDGGCTDGVIADFAFDRAASAGTFTPRACAPGGTPSGAATSIEFHARFADFLVADGRVLVEATESDAASGSAPVVYCREGANQSTISFLRFVLSTGIDAANCDISREYRDPNDGYYNGGTGGSSCSSMSYVRSATQIAWSDTDRGGADIDLTTGGATAGYPGVAMVTLTASTGATITPAVQCWANP